MLGVVAPTNQTFFEPKQADLLQDRFERSFPFSQAKSVAGLCHACFLHLTVELWVMIQTTKTERIGIPWDPVVFFENLDS